MSENRTKKYKTEQKRTNIDDKNLKNDTKR